MYFDLHYNHMDTTHSSISLAVWPDFVHF